MSEPGGTPPALSIRAAVALATVAGTVLPVVLLLWLWPELVTQREHLLWLLVAQSGLAMLLLWAALQWRLMRPLRSLKSLASRLGAPSELAAMSSRPSGSDELSDLDRHLGLAEDRIHELVGQLEASNAELRRMAMYDQLTGLPNRRLFRELFEHALAVARRGRQPMALMFIDLDRFKHINDTHGHPAGDALLLCISQRLRETARESDIIGRLGGDEFVALLPLATSFESIAHTALRLIHAVEMPVPLDSNGLTVRISASIGVARYPRDGDEFDDLLRRADQAMYRAKALGRGRYALYRDGQTPDLPPGSGADDELRQALKRGEMLLHYQPLVDTAQGRLVGTEALMRWQHPRDGLLSPSRFLRRAEEGGYLPALAHLSLDAACGQLARWRRAGHAPGRVAINVSDAQFRHPDWPDALGSALQRHAVERGQLEVELTEATLMADPESTQARVDMLHEMGVGVAIDDFGSGLISLARLPALQPTRIKLDANFVQRLPDDEAALGLIDGVVRLCRSLSIDVVAEGVETEAQRDVLFRLGCVRQQGHLFGAAQPALSEPPWPLPAWTARPRRPAGHPADSTLSPPVLPAYREAGSALAAASKHPKAH